MMRTRIAQAMYWLSGVTSKIKTPRHTYEIVSFDPLQTKRLPRSWQACGFSDLLLRGSVQVDPHHWDHWAVLHDRCGPARCWKCGGYMCGYDWEEDLYVEREKNDVD